MHPLLRILKPKEPKNVNLFLNLRFLAALDIRQDLGSNYFGSRFLFQVLPLANSVTISSLIVHRRLEAETAREMTGYRPSYEEAKKMKSLTLKNQRLLQCQVKGLLFISSSIID